MINHDLISIIMHCYMIDMNIYYKFIDNRRLNNVILHNTGVYLMEY